MLDLAQGVREQIIKETAPRVAAKKSLTWRMLRDAAFWGVGAAAALSIAVLSSRSEGATQRIADMFRGDDDRPAMAQVSQPTPESAAETQRLVQAVRGLSIDSEQIKSRLAAVEHTMDDATGSISRQVEAADAARRAEDGPSVMAVATTSATMAPTTTVAGFAPVAAANDASAMVPVMAPPATASQAAYGVDVGSGLTIQALRTRWMVIRTTHAQVFEGLQPIISVKDVPHGNKVELRLVAGPLADASAAAKLCASLTPVGLFCQPAPFDGQRLTLR